MCAAQCSHSAANKKFSLKIVEENKIKHFYELIIYLQKWSTIIRTILK